MKKIGVMLLATLLLIACDNSDDKKLGAQTPTQQIVEVKSKPLAVPLSFSGKVEPLEIFNVSSPVEGVVNKQFFRSGQQLDKGEKLFSLSADRLEKEYIDAISSYLKALDDYNEKKRKFVGTEELWQLKFISDNDYYADKTAKQESFFSFRQSVRALKETLNKVGITGDLKKYDLHDPKVVEKIVAMKLENYIIYSPYQGVALDPKSVTTESKESQKGLGSDVKQGEILLNIGDLSGISVQVQANEIDINQIKVGQKAIISGPGFPTHELEGKVQFVDSQAKSEGRGVPAFEVKVIVPKISENQKHWIRVGMTAKVEIILDEREVLMVPISAVFQEEGKDRVMVQADGDKKSVPVTVGKTSADTIEIIDGLKAGDKVIVSNGVN